MYIPRACLLERSFPAITRKVIYKTVLNWRALSFWLGPSKDSEARRFRPAQRSGLAPLASGPRISKVARSLPTPHTSPTTSGVLRKDWRHESFPALPLFPQTGKTEAGSGEEIQVRSACLVGPALPDCSPSRAQAQCSYSLEFCPGPH